MRLGEFSGRFAVVVGMVIASVAATTSLTAQEASKLDFRQIGEGLFVLDGEGPSGPNFDVDGVLVVGTESAMLVHPLGDGVLELATARSPVPIEHVVWTRPGTSPADSRTLHHWGTPGLRLNLATRGIDPELLPSGLIDRTSESVVDLGGRSVRLAPMFADPLAVEVRVEIVETRTLILPSNLLALRVRHENKLIGPSIDPHHASVREWRAALIEARDGDHSAILIGRRPQVTELEDTIALLGECLAMARGEAGETPMHDQLVVLIDWTGHEVVDLAAARQTLGRGTALTARRRFEWGRAPHQIAFAPTTHRQPNWAVAIAESDKVVHGGPLSIAYDRSNGTSVEVEVPGVPLGVAWMPDGDLAVTSFASNTISRVRGEEIIGTLEVGEKPSLLQGPMPFDRYLVSCEGSNECVVFDARNFGITARYPTGARPFPAGFTQDGRLAFVPNHEDGTVTVIDLWNEVVLDTVEVGDRPTGALCLPSPTGFDKYCLVACRGSDEIVVLNTASRLIEARVPTPGGPFSMIYDPEDDRVFVNLTEADAIGTLRFAGGPDRLDLLTLEEAHPCNDLPICIALHPGSGNLWVSHENSHDVSVYPLDGMLPAPHSPWPYRRRLEGHPSALGVLGMIHRGHRTSEVWGATQLEATIRAFRPDVVITEIPPDRWDRIWRDYGSRGVYEDPRIQPFVEYTDVLLPLKVELGFAIEPCAAWTTEMNDLRRARIQEFEESEDFAERREAYHDAEQIAEEQTTIVDTEDPFVIHTEEYDQAMAIRLGPYDAFLNEHIGPGGWTNINRSHNDLIEAAVARHPGKRVLITFGAGHKYQIVNRLRLRGYALEDMRDYLPR